MSLVVQLDLTAGRRAELLLQDPDPFPSSYFISMEHSGNAEFWQIAMQLLAAAKRSICKIGETLQKAGITREDITDAGMRSLLQTNGHAFGIFRNLNSGLPELDAAGHKTFIFVRDPRDVVMCEHFASRDAKESGYGNPPGEKSENDPSSALVSEPVVENIALRYHRFADFCRSARNVTVFRYEDCRFSWRKLVAELIEKLDLQISPQSALAIADSPTLFSHVSRLAGTDRRYLRTTFREHLDAAAIANLEEKFADPMAFFGYAPEKSLPAAFLDHQGEFVRAISERLQTADAQCSDLAAQIRNSPNGTATGPSKRSPGETAGGQTDRIPTDAAAKLFPVGEPDPTVAWRLRPNARCEWTVLGRRVVMEVDPNGCRPVVGQPQTGEKTLAVYGCSVTFGWAIPAEETFCTLLQGMFPTWRVENHGVGGYSGTQNLIQLQRDSRWSAADFVTFCWIPQHLLRNVADPTWLQKMVGRQKVQGAQPALTKSGGAPDPKPTFPRALLDRNGEVQFRWVKVPRWDILDIDWTDFSPDSHYLDLVCFGLFRKAAEVVKESGGHFFVTTLDGHFSPQLQRLLHDFGIPVVDASVRGVEYTCRPDDPHPNALANRIYAEKIRDYIVRRGTSAPSFSDNDKESPQVRVDRLSRTESRCSELSAHVQEAGVAVGPLRALGMTTAVARNDTFVPGPHGYIEADPVLRVRLKPNASAETTVLGRRVVLEVDADGCRPVVGQPQTGKKTVAFYGCSVTFGWAIPAEETFCSLLQSMLPTWRVENHGVPSYCATQNLIQLQRNIRWAAAGYVTFCWIPQHMMRNVADPLWIQVLSKPRNGSLGQQSPMGRPGVQGLTCPRASLDPDGKLQFRAVRFPRPDLVGIDLKDFSPDPHYLDLICFGLFRNAAEIVKESGGHFFVTTLSGHLSQKLQRMLDEDGIPVVDASVDGVEYTHRPDDPHPNALANRIYAEKIRDYIVQREAH
jgi:hypothetical protein